MGQTLLGALQNSTFEDRVKEARRFLKSEQVSVAEAPEEYIKSPRKRGKKAKPDRSKKKGARAS